MVTLRSFHRYSVSGRSLGMRQDRLENDSHLPKSVQSESVVYAPACRTYRRKPNLHRLDMDCLTCHRVIGFIGVR